LAWRSIRRLVGLSTQFVSASVNYIRRNFEKCLTQASDFGEPLTNSENASRDAEKLLSNGAKVAWTWVADYDRLEAEAERR
jgi:hypothetical protein